MLSVKAGFAASAVRSWSVEDVHAGLAQFRSARPGAAAMGLDDFVQAFGARLPTRDAVRFFKPFSERVSSARDRMASSSDRDRRGSVYTIFTGMCLLCASGARDKHGFLFSLFDLDGSKALSPDECTVLLTCLLRSLGTVGEENGALLKVRPKELDALVRAPFETAGVRYLDFAALRRGSTERCTGCWCRQSARTRRLRP